MFETIEREAQSSGGSGPQWMSSHPNPGNRTQYINKEAELLTIANPADESGFQRVKTAFASLPPAKSMSDLAKAKAPSGSETVQAVGTPGQPVPRPSMQYRQISGGKLFQASVPHRLDCPAIEECDQGRPAERLRPAQRTDGVQLRDRVRRGASGIA